MKSRQTLSNDRAEATMKLIYSPKTILKTLGIVRPCLLAITTAFLLAPPLAFSATEFQGNLNSVSITDAAGTNAPPTAKFTYIQKGDTFTFDASESNDSDGSIIGYKWDFGDGTKEVGKTVQHVSNNDASFNTTLTVIDNGNSVALYQQKITATMPATTLTSQEADHSYKITTDLYYSTALKVIGQSFTVPQTSTARSIVLYSNTATNINITVRIGTTTDLSSQYLTEGGLSYTPTSAGEITIPLNQPVDLQAGTTYYLVCFADGAYKNRISMQGSSASKYSQGKYVASSEGWPIKYSSDTIDLFFKVLGQVH